MKLIDKDALVVEIERIRKNQRLNDRHDQEILDRLHAIEKFLDTLEVKEVNLEKEIDKWWWNRTWQTYGMILNKIDIEDFAKHFFELGLKAHKGE